MMLNEVRRKPEKPRIIKDGEIFYCYGKQILGMGAGWTRREAYEDWKKLYEKYQPSTTGHK